MTQNSLKWNPEHNFKEYSDKIHLQCWRNIKLINEVFKDRLKSVSLVITSLLTSLHDISMEGMNTGFRNATDKFGKVINISEKIIKGADEMFEILSKGHHSTIVIIGASTVAVLTGLVIALILYMVKITEQFKEKNKVIAMRINEIKDLKASWSKLDTKIK